VPLTLDRQAIVALSDTPTSRETPKGFARLSSPIVLDAKSSTVISVSTPIGGTVPSNAAGFTVYCAGSTQNGTPVRMSAIFEVPLAERDQNPQMPRPRWDEILVARTWPWDEVMTAMRKCPPGGQSITATQHTMLLLVKRTVALKCQIEAGGFDRQRDAIAHAELRLTGRANDEQRVARWI
jgi:hypothetical protein